VGGEAYVRAAIGTLLAAHGAHGLFGSFGDYDLAAPGLALAPWFELPRTVPLVAGGIELGCGVLLALGHATRAVAALALATMLGALLPVPFGIVPAGSESAALLSALMLFYLVRGTGPISSTTAQRAVAVHIRDVNRLVARVTTTPWFRARLPTASPFTRRRIAARAKNKRRIPSKSTQRRVT
jgi:uncharacterized membrane protein YphA (DoxX/SURF4 family)